MMGKGKIDWKSERFERWKVSDVNELPEGTNPRQDVVEIFRDWWWIVTPDEEILVYDEHAPQGNPNPDITKMLVSRYEGCTARQLSLVILPHRT